MRYLAIITLLTLIHLLPQKAAYAQCPDDAEYCYSHTAAGDRLVAFFEGKEAFTYLDADGKDYELPLPESAVMDDLVKLFEDRAARKLGPIDALVIREALLKWDSVQIYIGFEQTESGLYYKIDEKGDGPLPEEGQTVKVHYKGSLPDGTVFDSSYERDQPIEFPLGEGRVIKGWDEGIQLFPVGSKGTLIIPPNLGYGARGAGGIIPPNATLVFEIELLEAK